MHILLIRHGEPVTAFSESGPVDPELTARGTWQAARLGEWLACEPIDSVVASNQRRAIETAGPLGEQLSLKTKIIPDLAEIDRNARFYAPPPILPERFPEYYAEIVAGNFDKIGWDSFPDFSARVLRGWRSLLENPPGQRVAVACHGGTIGAILSHVLGIEAHRLLQATPFASITRLEIDSDQAKLVSLHETAHFDGARQQMVGPDGQGFPDP